MMEDESGLFADEDEGLFADEDEGGAPAAPAAAAPWKVLIVDDDPEVHEVTKFALSGVTLEDRPLSFISAYSGAEGLECVRENTDLALAFVDVVMETDEAGLRLARQIREDLGEELTRLILRTGQPGQAPEKQVILDYDINDYKTKSELTSNKLFTTVISALRAYRDMEAIEKSRRGLETVIESSSSIFELQAMERFVSGVLTQLTSLLRLEEDTLYCNASTFMSTHGSGEPKVLAGTGKYAQCDNRTLGDVVSPQVRADLERAASEGQSLYLDDRAVIHFRSQDGHDNMIYVEGCRIDNELDRQLLEIFCSNATTAFDNIVLNQEIEDTQREVIFLLGDLTENRSKETGDHIQRVGEYCYMLADLAGLSEEEAQLVQDASPMHDIGKIAIPDAILNKPGRLTDEEFETIKTHPELGYNMLKGSQRRLIRAAAIIAHQHHERYDGRGYPQGLAGEDIHIYGRIAAIADVFDALATPRCYKDPWSADAIKGLLDEERGAHFDPNLAGLVLDNFDDFWAVRSRYFD